MLDVILASLPLVVRRIIEELKSHDGIELPFNIAIEYILILQQHPADWELAHSDVITKDSSWTH